MLAEIFLAALVIVVFLLVALDGYRVRSEGSHGPVEALARDGQSAAFGAVRGGRDDAFGREPAGTGAGPGAATPASDAGQARRAEGASPPVAGAQRVRTGPPAVRQGRSLKNWSVGSRLLLLVAIPTVAVAAVAFFVVRLTAALHGTAIHSPVGSVHHRALASAIVYGVVAIVVVALAAWFAVVAARSVLRPLRRLRAGARQLPDVVHSIGQSNGQGRPSDVRTLDIDSSDEIGEIARAFEQMRAEFLRQVSGDAALRAKLNAMFLNLSHRGQSLAERQIRLIDALEQGEQDAGRRANLFRMDRIAARMHRSSQNLLIVAGHEQASGWNQPVAIAEVVRAAASEIEDSERVSLNAQPDVAERGPAVNDVVHLLAELIENATSFSSADMPVDISGQVLATGGALVDVTDRGIGMAARDMAYANWQLENPSTADINVPRWMGLFVVARLAARHGVRVRLHAAEFGGLTALVWLPDEILTHRGATASLRLGGSASAASMPSWPDPAPDLQPATAGQRVTTARLTEHALASEGGRDATPSRRPTFDLSDRPGPQGQASDQRPASRAEPPAAPGPSGYWPPDAAATLQGGTSPLSQERAPAGRDVSLPPAEDPAEEAALPIYDEVQSRWFGGGGQAPGSAGRTAVGGSRWPSSADEGWRAAQAVDSPSSGAPTAAGLPRRLPNANLVPGAIPGSPTAAPTRSAAAARDRLAGFQRGVSEGRAAAGEAASADENDQS